MLSVYGRLVVHQYRPRTSYAKFVNWLASTLSGCQLPAHWATNAPWLCMLAAEKPTITSHLFQHWDTVGINEAKISNHLNIYKLSASVLSVLPDDNWQVARGTRKRMRTLVTLTLSIMGTTILPLGNQDIATSVEINADLAVFWPSSADKRYHSQSVPSYKCHHQTIPR